MSTVEHILMTKGPDVITVSSEATVIEAVKLMCEADVGATIVSDDNGISGIFTERDLLKRVVAAGKNPQDTKVVAVMTHSVTSVSLDTPIQVCLDMMLTGKFRNIIVCNSGVLIGQVSLASVLAASLEK